ncbi:MAG TPA: protein kinase [Vicinamibacterales bacterium]
MSTSPERWIEVERLYHEALARAERARDSFLHKACGDDEELRREVMSLLAYDRGVTGFMEGAAIDVLAAQASAAGTAEHTLTGQRVGPYEIGPLIGSGGMGHVYRAHDSKLGRAVALKILPHHFADDAERRARFEREAKLLASLNHPHIGAIYGFEDRDGVYGLVLELIEGHTLSERLRTGPIPVAQALTLARQIANALEAAHARGIVHRDLKPANVMLTSDGAVKLLDFGLAKSRAAMADAETTGVGVVVGTAAYMSPEQARGEETDARTDVWAFGCVVSEMLTGHKAFAGATASDTIAAILTSEPDWRGLPASTPEPVQRLLQRCLEKDPKQRLHDIADARIELDDVHRDESGGVVRKRGAYRGRALLIGAAALVLAAIALVGWMLRRPEAPVRPTRLSISTPGFISPQLSGIVSPDGTRVAFVSTAGSGKLMLWIRALDDLEARMVPGSEDAAHPFWSPDGQQIGFLADGRLKITDPTGAAGVRVLTDAPLRSGASWSRQDMIVFVRPDGLAMIPASGGTPTVVIARDRDGCQEAWPAFLPDATHILFFCRGREDQRGVYVGSVETHEKKRLISGGLRPAYASGHLFTVRGETLMAYPFDTDRLQTTGDPVPVADGIWTAPGAGQASYSVSNDGVLAYVNAAVSKAQFSWFDRGGKLQGRIGERDRSFATPQLSPDARRLLIAQGPTAADHVWVMDATGGASSRLTFGSGRDYSPVWSPNAMRLAYLSGGSRGGKIMLKNADGSGAEQAVFESDRLVSIDAWSPDGRFVVFTATGPRSLSDIWLLPVAGAKRATPFLESPFNKTQAQVSPDSRWIAYTSYESGGDEVYVESFPTPGSKKQVSVGGGVQPRWRRDGKELFYLATDGRLMATAVMSGKTLAFGETKPLFKTAVIPHGSQSIGLATYYDVTPDGQRFLCVIPSASDTTFAPITVVLNWQAALRK